MSLDIGNWGFSFCRAPKGSRFAARAEQRPLTHYSHVNGTWLENVVYKTVLWKVVDESQEIKDYCGEGGTCPPSLVYAAILGRAFKNCL